MNSTEAEPAKPIGEILTPITTMIAAYSQNRRRFEAAERDRRITAFRSTWNAPLRHLQCEPTRKGIWNEKLMALTARMQTGEGMLAALVGKRGNGKTQMAVELMKLATSQLKSARFTTAVGFFIKVKSTFKREAITSEEDVLVEFQKPHLLVIDEFEKRADTLWENNLIFELLNRRYNARKDTVLIANDTPSQFDEYAGSSVVSRINETGGVVECDWASFR